MTFSLHRLGNSTQKLSADQSRASNAIRDWGYAEGDDLGVSYLTSLISALHRLISWLALLQDVLAKVSQLFDYLASAELAYAEHSTQYRSVSLPASSESSR